MNKIIAAVTIPVFGLIMVTSVSYATTVYVPLGEANQVQVIDAGNDRVTGVVEGVDNAHGLAITPDGRYLVAGSYSELPPGLEDAPPRPEGVSAAEHEKHHAKPDQSADAQVGTSYVSVIDSDTRKVVRRIAVRGAVHHVAAVRDTGTLYVSSRAESRLRVVDQKTLLVKGELEIGGIGHQMAVAMR